MSDEYARNYNSRNFIAYHNFNLGGSGGNFKNALGTVGRMMGEILIWVGVAGLIGLYMWVASE